MIWGDNIEVGDGVTISETDTLIDCHVGKLTIGDNVHILDGVKIWTHNHSWRPYTDDEIPADLEIGDNTIIGAYTLILPQCQRIGKNVVIGAGSVVTKSIPDGETWAGNPATQIGNLRLG